MGTSLPLAKAKTEAMGARLIRDLSLAGSSSPTELIDIEGILYFVADPGGGVGGTDNDQESTSSGSGIGLWKSDGSDGGTRLIRSFDGISNLVKANGFLYFIAETGGGYDIWSSDGTFAGTQKVEALNPGSSDFAAYNLFAVNDTLFFSASDSDESNNGYELWRWDGYDVGTKIFRNLFPDRYITKQSIEFDEETGQQTLTVETAEIDSTTPEYSPDSFPGNFTNAGGGNFFFTAYATQSIKAVVDGFADEFQLGGIELWFSNGTESGTYPILINNESYNIYNPVDGTASPPSLYEENYIAKGSSFPKNLTLLNDKLYFTANDGINGVELWRINSTGLGDMLVKDIHPTSSSNPQNLTVVGEKLYFTADDGNGRELWVVENDNITQKVENSGENPQHLTEIGGNLYYSANSNQGREPWVIEPNKPAKQLQDINPGIKSSNPKNFQLIRVDSTKKKTSNFLFFTANDGKHGIELWNQNISEDGAKVERYTDIYEGAPSSDPRNLISSNERLFFTANDGNSGRELWTIDDLNESIPCNPDSQENCDGDQPDGGDQPGSTNTNLVKNIRREELSSDPSELYNHRSELFFSANDGRNGYEPWTSTGTAKSTKLFEDINKGSNGSYPSSFIGHKKKLFFAADDGRQGSELWVSNEGKNGTKLAADIQHGEGGSSPSDLLTQGRTLYLSADDGIHGRELWSYNIKTSKHRLVRDIRTGSGVGSNPSELIAVNGQIIFAAEGNVYGRELWRSDGTKNGTKMLLDINPGGLDSNPKDLSLLERNLYFIANTYFNGRQILKLDGSGLNVTEIIGSLGQATSSEPSDLYASKDQLFFNAETTLDSTKESTPSSPSTGGGSNSGSDPGGFMVAADGIEAKAVEYINNYNDNIDSYRRLDSSDSLDSAKFWADQLATSILVDNNDASLAIDWNQYFQTLSKSSPLQIPEDLPSNAATRSSGGSPGNNSITPSEEENANILGRELWISNGKVDGNTLLKDIFPGEGSSNPQGFTTVGTKTYFSANDGEFGEELWVTDGTESGTFMLSDINTGPKDSSPRSITEVDGVIYFSAKTDRYGRELWKLGEPEISQAKNGGNNSNQDQDVELARLVYDAAGKGRLRGKRNTSDEFIFSRDNQFGAKRADHIIGFSAQEGDMIQLNADAFPGFKRKRFKVVNSLKSFNRQLEQSSSIIYFKPLGELYFDRNGREPGLGDPKESGLFAVLKGAPTLNATDISLI